MNNRNIAQRRIRPTAPLWPSSTFGSNSPSPFHSSFGPTPTAATVTPAAASGTTAPASASTSANMLSNASPSVPAVNSTAVIPPTTATNSTTVNSTAAATSTAITASSAATITLATPPNLIPPMFSALSSASSTTATNLTTTTAPGVATTTSVFGSANVNTNPHVFGVTTPLFTSTSANGVFDTKSKESVPIDITKSICFRFQWPHAEAMREKIYSQTYKAKTDGGQFSCVVKAVENCFLFQILCQTDEDFASLQWVSTGVIRSTDKTLEIVSAASRWPMSRMISISGPILSNRFTVMDGNSSVEITLSNDSTLKRTPGPNSQASNVHHCDTILGNMLHDSSTYDVFFEFEPPEGETIYDCEPVAGDEKGFVEVKKEEADESVKDEKDKDEKDKDENDKGKESALSSISDDKKNAGGQDAAAIWDKVGAHKIVLSQFEYFKTMFSSSFAEGGPGVKTIKIKDTDVQCFRILIEYLYLGRLGLFSTPRTLTEDEANDTSPTWEDVYLIADRYNVVDLRRMAASRILLGLNTKWAVAFLFRTAYLFDDLRTPVITYIVQKSMPQIVTKDALEKYYDHPECGSIMVELLAALWKVKTVQATSFFTVGSPTSASSTKKE